MRWLLLMEPSVTLSAFCAHCALCPAKAAWALEVQGASRPVVWKISLQKRINTHIWKQMENVPRATAKETSSLKRWVSHPGQALLLFPPSPQCPVSPSATYIPQRPWAASSPLPPQPQEVRVLQMPETRMNSNKYLGSLPSNHTWLQVSQA